MTEAKNIKDMTVAELEYYILQLQNVIEQKNDDRSKLIDRSDTELTTLDWLTRALLADIGVEMLRRGQLTRIMFGTITDEGVKFDDRNDEH
jgi:hypothetical protein